jgi:tetratricopeptide (TPR) repeat protein
MDLRALRRRADELAGESRWTDLLRLLDRVPEPERVASREIAYRVGEALYHVGRMEPLSVHASRFELAARRDRDVAGIMRALNLKGIAAFELGRPDEARRAFDDLMALAQAEGDDDMLARATLNLGALANLQGDPGMALSLYQLALPLFHKLGQIRGLSQTHQSLAISYRDLGRYSEAEDEYQKAVQFGLGFGYTPIVAMAVIGRAEVLVLRRDPQAALGLVDWGLQLARQLGDRITEGTGLRVRALARAALNEIPEARSDLEEALNLARSTGNTLLEAESLRDLGRLMLLQGDESKAGRLFETALDRFRQLGSEQAVSDTERELESLGSQPPAG